MAKPAWLLVLAGLLYIGSAAPAAVIYDFTALPIDTNTPFIYPGSLPATFSSADNLPVFAIVPSFFATLEGNVLLEIDPSEQRWTSRSPVQ
jgi:hypothetical protein